MTKYNLISFGALLALILILPFYALQENNRLSAAQEDLQAQFLLEGSVLYIQNCAECHGTNGAGLAANPPLNNLGNAGADPNVLFKTIARAAHGSSMAAWHIDEGGSLSDVQIEKLVTLIRYGDWAQVDRLAAESGYRPELINTMGMEETFLEGLAEEDPHQCIACHEQPQVHEERFGYDCVRCHTLVAWTPALLTRHTFALDHGDSGTVACETCHTVSYTENTCYECHDHKPSDMVSVHETEGILDLENCETCHPTGAPDEARDLIDNSQGEVISQGS